MDACSGIQFMHINYRREIRIKLISLVRHREIYLLTPSYHIISSVEFGMALILDISVEFGMALILDIFSRVWDGFDFGYL